MFISQCNVIGGKFVIQSSSYSPDYLESRINQFIKYMKEEAHFTQEEFENVKKATI